MKKTSKTATSKAKAGEIKPQAFAKVQADLEKITQALAQANSKNEKLEKRVSELQTANALQYSVASGVDMLGEAVEALKQLSPTQKALASSVEAIASKIPQGPSRPEPSKRQAQALNAITDFHPSLNLDFEAEVPDDDVKSNASESRLGEKK